MLSAIVCGVFVFMVLVISIAITVSAFRECISVDDWACNIVLGGAVLVAIALNVTMIYAYVSSFATCPNCGDTHFYEEYCPECGASLCAPDIICHKCQTKNDGGSNYCYKCGEELRGESDE